MKTNKNLESELGIMNKYIQPVKDKYLVPAKTGAERKLCCIKT